MYTLIFDTETTGLPKNWGAPLSDGENWPRLVQLSWIITDGVNKREFDFIIKPNGFEIPEEVSKIHGINHEKAMAEGEELKFVLDLFNSFVNMADKVVAHNIKFDRAIVGAEHYRIGGGEKFDELIRSKERFCTMMESTAIVKLKGTHGGGSKWPRLIELYKFLFNEEFSGAHNSLNDTRACARCYFELMNRK